MTSDCHDCALLTAEMERLRAEIARLTRQVEELDRLAHDDPLVRAVNRRGLVRELERLIARRQRHAAPAAMLFVDLDDLKILNDSFGHQGGDAALIHVAEQLHRGTRSSDCIARLGGDEFCVLLDSADEKSALKTAERLIDAIAGEDFLFEGLAMPLSVAIGMTMIEEGDTPARVLARADQAMYRVKDAA